MFTHLRFCAELCLIATPGTAGSLKMMFSQLVHHLSHKGEAGFVPNHDQISKKIFAISTTCDKNKYNLTRKRTYVCNEEVVSP